MYRLLIITLISALNYSYDMLPDHSISAVIMLSDDPLPVESVTVNWEKESKTGRNSTIGT